MFFELNGKTYCVKFSRTGTTTFANLVLVDEWGLNFLGYVGIASLFHMDRFVKSIGRKVALANLLKRMGEPDAGETEPPFNLSKEDRARIWAAYFERHSK